jgi:hypothetical protein
METDEQLEELLRDTFAQARGEGRGQWSRVGAGAFARADRLRRRRVGMTVGAVAATVAVVGAALGVGAGLLGRDVALSPAVTSSTSASAKPWASLVPGTAPFAYRFPDDVVPDPLPAGARPLNVIPVTTAGSGPSSTATSRLAVTVTDQTPDLGGVAGFCRWEELAELRQPVAGQSYQFTLGSAPGRLGAILGLAGFTTGTGADAMADLRNAALPCLVPTDLKAVDWTSDGDESLLFTATETVEGAPQTVAMAVTRVGDVLLSGTARGRDAVEARKVATSLSSEAASRLLREAFPPAVGEPLGDSAAAPNAASEVGAGAAEPVRQPDEYEFGDVFPAASQLRFGMSYHGDPLVSRNMPAATGAQVCDLSGQPERQATSDAAPHPVAGSQQDAWAGDGAGADPSVSFGVTGWPTGSGAVSFRDLQQDTGMCAWMPHQQRVSWPGADPQATWLSHSTEGGGAYLAARRVGDVIVSVVVDTLPADDAKAEAIRLSGIVAAKVEASGLPAAKGR